jgi:ferritin-like metal-binding protein YciE
MSRTPGEELVSFLSDLYSMELQAIAQLESAPQLAGAPSLAADFQTHLAETEQQADKIRARLEALGGSPSVIKDTLMKLGGKAFLLFAKLQLETPGRLLTHAYSYEAMEWGGYAVLIRMAEAMNDPETAQLGREIQAEERLMMQRLEREFDVIENFTHHDLPPDELRKHLLKHLAEVHALEIQSIKLLEKAVDIAGHPTLATLYAEHLEESRSQTARVERRLHSLGADDPTFQDAALKLGALNWGLFFQAQQDTPAKLLAFAYAVEHLEIAAYELLLRSATHAGDAETADLCRKILSEERAMTERLADSVDVSVDATLRALEK